MEINLSILIPTHNRPKQFKNCIGQVLSQLDELDNFNINYNIEIIVNNDSNDIEEIYDQRVSVLYYYKDTLKEGYFPHEFLYSVATKDWIYILEDDDLISKSFFKNIYKLNNIDSNIIIGTYIPDNNYKLYFEYFKNWQTGYYKFNNIINLFTYQFGQILFKNKIIESLFDKQLHHKFNDCIPLLQFIDIENKVYLTKDIFYIQYLDSENKTNVSYQYNDTFEYKNFKIDHLSGQFNMEKI